MGNRAIRDYSTSNAIEIVRGEAECYFNCSTSANSTGYPCYHSLVVGQLLKKSIAIVATLYCSITISLFQD